MKKFYYQVYFHEQDSYITDTVEFEVPDDTSEENVADAVDAGMNALDEDSYEDRLEYADDVLRLAAQRLNGKWHYINVVGVLEVE